LARPDFAKVATALLDALGADVALHIRGPRTSGRRVHDMALAVAGSLAAGRLFVNDRVDVALAVGAGVHLGSRSMSVSDAHTIVGQEVVVGRSIRDQADEGAGADYLFAGPVFDTPSHADVRGRGAAWLADIAAQTAQPVVGIGGISVERIGVLLDAGAHGVAVIRSVWDTPDPIEAASDLRHQLVRTS